MKKSSIFIVMIQINQKYAKHFIKLEVRFYFNFTI